MRELRREIEIDALPERVWAVVTDFAAYPEWNPFIRRISGELQPQGGARMKLQGKRWTCPHSRSLIVLRVEGKRWSLAQAAAANGCE